MTTEKTDEKPEAKPLSANKKRRARVRAAAAGAHVQLQRYAVTGRPRSLDPDQATLDKNLKTILGAAAMNCSMAETAALHDVGPETLAEFFLRYPEIRVRYDEAKLTGVASVKRNQFALSAKSPQMAIWLGEQILGQRDPYKIAEIDRKEREFAEHVRLENEKLTLRERDVAAKERLLEMRAPADLGSGLPIDIKSLSLPQLMQLAERIRAALTAGSGLTIEHVAAREPEKTA